MIAAAPPLAELATRLLARERERARTAKLPAASAVCELATISRATDPGAARSEPAGKPPRDGGRFGAALAGPGPVDLVGALAIACGDLADGFAAPPESRRRLTAHHRAWIAVREIDRAVTAAARHRLVPPEIVKRAQRAIDRADVLIGALLPA